MEQCRSFTEFVKANLWGKLRASLADYLAKDPPPYIKLCLKGISKIKRIELVEAEIYFVSVVQLVEKHLTFDVAVKSSLAIHGTDKEGKEQARRKKTLLKMRCRGSLADSLAGTKRGKVEACVDRARERGPLCDSLAHALQKKSHDQAAEEILKNHYAKARRTPTLLDAAKLVSRLGLKLEKHRLSKDGSVFGQVFFLDSEAAVYDGEAGEEKKIAVKRGTVLIDPDAAAKTKFGGETGCIVHECVHWLLHQRPLVLERLFNAEAAWIRCRADGGADGGSELLLWMEHHADDVALRILMPQTAFDREAGRQLAKLGHATGIADTQELLPLAAEKLAVTFGVSAGAAQERLEIMLKKIEQNRRRKAEKAARKQAKREKQG